MDKIMPHLLLPECNCLRRHIYPMVHMHVIAHNAIAHGMDFHHQILAKWKKFNEFMSTARGKISDIESFKLEWCRMKMLLKVSIGKNKLDFMHLTPYLH